MEICCEKVYRCGNAVRVKVSCREKCRKRYILHGLMSAFNDVYQISFQPKIRNSTGGHSAECCCCCYCKQVHNGGKLLSLFCGVLVIQNALLCRHLLKWTIDWGIPLGLLCKCWLAESTSAVKFSLLHSKVCGTIIFCGQQSRTRLMQGQRFGVVTWAQARDV